MSVLTRWRERLSSTQAQVEAADLAEVCARPGCCRIDELQARSVAQVTGTVHSLAMPPTGHRPEVRVELYDGSGVIELVWMGRRAIAGIEPGAYLTVSGRVAHQDDRLLMYNPAYTLLPGHG